MTPYGWTHIALGFEFGWHVLSSNAPFTEGVPETDKNTMKVLVLLTDGNQTEQAFGRAGSETKEDGERNLESLCRNAKAAGITVATVALDLDDATTVARLRGCASDPNKLFFDATNRSRLATAFEAISRRCRRPSILRSRAVRQQVVLLLYGLAAPAIAARRKASILAA
jgi:hypothetical protein